MLTVSDFARRAGISSRAVRQRIQAGTLEAQRAGRAWLLPESALPAAARRPGRRLSVQSFDQLAAYMDLDDGALAADERRRARERATMLRERGLDRVVEFARRSGLVVRHLFASDDDLAELRAEGRLVPTGVSHPDAEVYGPVIDAYVSSVDCRDIELFHLLEPVDRSRSNVILRVQDPPPVVRRLHVIADLLDDRTERSRLEAERLFAELMRGRDG
ncbi:helix-turn-helix domain-containing protein [Brachybacterium halotolerans subsp. kimchii]|uniref:helix-turn-helix domain-containing protein n=1 Tax=Brachybacterium halotolerans TaxID=2795215 RepID=UPI001E36BC36|nr:helix-turn-helix domain-containing protein [Brachybacterium halotolerans]UEJ81511.1 helix-turn-helix domain-containing protein [Brachybacterium halotolerans subsp. kimchii]